MTDTIPADATTAPDRLLDLIRQHDALTDTANLPGTTDDERNALSGQMADIEDLMAETPITSKTAAMAALAHLVRLSRDISFDKPQYALLEAIHRVLATPEA